MDQVAQFMLQPGTLLFPDQRCVLRLVTSLRNPGSDWVPKLLLSIMPVPVQTMIGMLPEQVEGSVLTAIVRVWWDYNGRTVFFSHHLTAKLVRRMVKASGAGQEPHQSHLPPVPTLPADSPSPASPRLEPADC